LQLMDGSFGDFFYTSAFFKKFGSYSLPKNTQLNLVLAHLQFLSRQLYQATIRIFFGLRIKLPVLSVPSLRRAVPSLTELVPPIFGDSILDGLLKTVYALLITRPIPHV